jgi:hypothetical protein
MSVQVRIPNNVTGGSLAAARCWGRWQQRGSSCQLASGGSSLAAAQPWLRQQRRGKHGSGGSSRHCRRQATAAKLLPPSCRRLKQYQQARHLTISQRTDTFGRVLARGLAWQKQSSYKTEGVGGQFVGGSKKNIMVRVP